MKNWKAVIGTMCTIGLLAVTACEQKKEPPKPPPPDPLTACRNECKSKSEAMFKECSDKLASEQKYDQMSTCNTQADDFSKQCRAECDQKVGTH
jgi:hypothetical protein